jgi:hypothetical protein
MCGKLSVVAAVVVMGVSCLALPATVSAELGLVELSDAELDSIQGGFLDDMTYEFDGEILSFVGGNSAYGFDIGIGSNAFRSSEGIITTIQAVNSVIDLDIFVNIYLNGRGL